MPGVVADAASVAPAAPAAATVDPPKVKLRVKPGSSNWQRPKSHTYDSNYAKGSRLYSGTLGKLGRNSELASNSDPLYRPAPSALGSYVESLIGGSVLTQDFGSTKTRKSAIRSSHARETDSTTRQTRVSSWVGSTTGTEVTVIPQTAMIAAEQQARMQEEIRAAEADREARRARRRQVTSLHEEHLNMIEERERRLVEQELQAQNEDFARRRYAMAVARKEAEQRKVRATSVETVISVDGAETIIDHEHEARRTFNHEMQELQRKLVVAENKAKSEGARVKRELNSTIANLEASVEATSKQNADLHRNIKRLNAEINERESHYNECYSELQSVVNQLSMSKQTIQSQQHEMESLQAQIEKAHEAKKSVDRELKVAEENVAELEKQNEALHNARGKAEIECEGLRDAYDQLTKELRNSDERTKRVIDEAKMTKDALVEERERVLKHETIKKHLEMEVRELAARVNEVEANAQTTNKRVIAGLQTQLRCLETELDEEKRRHMETHKQMHRREKESKAAIVRIEEEQTVSNMLQENCDKLTEQIKRHKQRLSEQEAKTQEAQVRERRLHRSWVTTSAAIPNSISQFFVTDDD